MVKLFTLSVFVFSVVISSQRVEAQSVARSDKAVFYNFVVKRCVAESCAIPYTIDLENVNTVRGNFKGVNPHLKPQLETSSFLVTAFDKHTGEKLYESVVKNPVDINVEFDGEGHTHQGDCGLQHKTISLPEGHLAVRLPFSPDECTLSISYIERHDKVVPLGTF